MKQAPVITIDGPAGVGKGTACMMLVRHLGWNLLDSGALYRVLAHAVREKSTPLDDAEALSRLAENLALEFQTRRSKLDDGYEVQIILDGIDVSSAVRSEACGNAASKVAALPEVRAALLQRQRAMRQAPGLIADGRDMGTAVFPDAEFKVFLSADPEERAKRRYKQLKEKGINVTLSRISADMKERDERDRGRNAAPLLPAPDALVLDTTNLSVVEMFERILQALPDTLKNRTS